MKPGDIHRIAYPVTGGREQHGERPGIILQDERFAAKSPLVITIPLTSSAGTLRFPAVVPVPADAVTGLTVPSFALLLQLRATDRLRIGPRIGELPPAVLSAVYAMLDRLTGRP